jgi:hypothetical protein
VQLRFVRRLIENIILNNLPLVEKDYLPKRRRPAYQAWIKIAMTHPW